MSFATSHYATGMQLVVVYNYFGHVCNYKFGIVQIFSHTVVCATHVQLNVYNMDMRHKNDGLNLYILQLLYLIYLHKLCIIIYVPPILRLTPC
jgi:hypothetical protein